MRKKLRTIKINLLIIISILASTLFSGCTQEQNNVSANTVSIENLAFNPSTLTVSVGTTVTWINNDNVDHTVNAEDGLFNSDTLSKGENCTYTFNEPGTYNYICGLHPSMRGTIMVQ